MSRPRRYSIRVRLSAQTSCITGRCVGRTQALSHPKIDTEPKLATKATILLIVEGQHAETRHCSRSRRGRTNHARGRSFGFDACRMAVDRISLLADAGDLTSDTRSTEATGSRRSTNIERRNCRRRSVSPPTPRRTTPHRGQGRCADGALRPAGGHPRRRRHHPPPPPRRPPPRGPSPAAEAVTEAAE